MIVAGGVMPNTVPIQCQEPALCYSFSYLLTCAHVDRRRPTAWSLARPLPRLARAVRRSAPRAHWRPAGAVCLRVRCGLMAMC